MAANPQLCAGPGNVAAPAMFAGEQGLVLRDGVDLEIDGLECVALVRQADGEQEASAHARFSTGATGSAYLPASAATRVPACTCPPCA